MAGETAKITDITDNNNNTCHRNCRWLATSMSTAPTDKLENHESLAVIRVYWRIATWRVDGAIWLTDWLTDRLIEQSCTSWSPASLLAAATGCQWRAVDSDAREGGYKRRQRRRQLVYQNIDVNLERLGGRRTTSTPTCSRCPGNCCI